jgi:hypothetical protein
MEHCPPVKKHGILLFASTKIELEAIMLSEKNLGTEDNNA